MLHIAFTMRLYSQRRCSYISNKQLENTFLLIDFEFYENQFIKNMQLFDWDRRKVSATALIQMTSFFLVMDSIEPREIGHLFALIRRYVCSFVFPFLYAVIRRNKHSICVWKTELVCVTLVTLLSACSCSYRVGTCTGRGSSAISLGRPDTALSSGRIGRGPLIVLL